MAFSSSKNLVLNLIKSNLSFYSFSKETGRVRNENLQVFNKKKWNKINLIETTNSFLLLPHKLPEFLKNINIDKTIEFKTKSLKKVEKINDINLTFFYSENMNVKKADNINHIGKILLNEFLNNRSKSKEVYIATLQKKLYVCIIENKKLLFYNKFEFNGSNYIKYILLIFDEYNLDRKKNAINILDKSFIQTPLKNFFNKINLYKKSIFEIIEEYYG